MDNIAGSAEAVFDIPSDLLDVLKDHFQFDSARAVFMVPLKVLNMR